MIDFRNLIEKIVYGGGINYNFYDTDVMIDTLGKVAPKMFFGRKITDIGCGDGENTLKIAKVLKAKEVQGVEVTRSFAKTANKKGLKITILRPGQKVSGDLGVLWGVVHHFTNPAEDMAAIVKNFKSLIIREPTDYRRWWEAGKRIKEKEMSEMVEKAAQECGKTVNKVLVPKGKSALYFIG